ncbi:Phosphotransferase enzyme family protein [Pyrenophora tritici-repentis]|uniref:Phosphotransferase enzyme family protein n=1 Tax=Pyrenophora tritici-repentis TaxID=45151 RepID=A0A922NCN8_9PLEO|nr:Phosphotransferase enzyme family protein [Pyrenophora tritici-repentis]KAI1674450.1 Phosphotransferase enzyme family protein [Pyrenophora tritici-repentis]KAI1688434.1 Phosphotransferase enzyme family protein [Pyrenophora tritici-repentis]
MPTLLYVPSTLLSDSSSETITSIIVGGHPPDPIDVGSDIQVNHWVIYLQLASGGSIRLDMVPNVTPGERGTLFVSAIEYEPSIDFDGVIIFDKGTKLVRITTTAGINIAIDVLPQEALNMEYVRKFSNGEIRIPRVYRYFMSGEQGYIVTDFIDGGSLDAIPWSSRTIQERQYIVDQMMKAFDHMRTMRSSEPEPVGRGVPEGALFSVWGAGRTLETAADMETCFNAKLKFRGGEDVTGRFEDLGMCHMDIKLRNLAFDKAGQLWFLDWAWSGFFPPIFEHAGLVRIQEGWPDCEFAQDLLRELRRKPYDETLLALVLGVYEVNNGVFAGRHLISYD